MVKFDVSMLRFLEDDDFRVLTALEMALRNHELAPTVLIERIAGLPHGGARRRLNTLLKHKMIHHENKLYDGFSMKYMAYDYLALRTFAKRGTVQGVASRIGCGKESDIILIKDENGNDAVLKLQRLGRCSFRSVTRNRDYKGGMRKRHGASWFYLSRLAAQKEFAFMKLLHDEGFPVPKPIDQNRHAIVMELVRDATLLNNIDKMDLAQKVYEKCLALIVKLAQNGLVHGDFNEFNLFITNSHEVIMIDFPQMVSIDHPNAGELFDRDVNNLALFFDRRFGLKMKYFPKLEKDVTRSATLDRNVYASGSISEQQLRDMELLAEENDDLDENDDDDEEEDEEQDGDWATDEDEEEDVDEDMINVQRRNEELALAQKQERLDKKRQKQKNNDDDADSARHASDDDGEEEEEDELDAEAQAIADALRKQKMKQLKQQATAQKQQSKQQDQHVSQQDQKAQLSKAKLDAAAAAAASAEQQQQNAAASTAAPPAAGDGGVVSLAQLARGTDDFQLNQAAAEAGATDDEVRSQVAPSVTTSVQPQMLAQDIIKLRTRRELQVRDDQQFRQNMHRNCQKGREKQRIKRQMQGVKGTDGSDW